MSFSDKIAIAAAVIAFSGFTIKGTLLFLRTKKDKIKTTLKNPYIRCFLLVIILSVLFAFLPLEKFHYGDVKQRIVYLPAPKTQMKQLLKKDSVIKEKPNIAAKTHSTSTPKKNYDASKSISKYDLRQATISQSAVGDNAKVENFNGIKARHLDSGMFVSLLKRLDVYWNTHPNAETNLIYVAASPDKDSRRLAAELIYYLKENNYKVKTDGVLVSPMQSNNNENFDVGIAVNNKDVMVTVMEQPNIQ